MTDGNLFHHSIFEVNVLDLYFSGQVTVSFDIVLAQMDAATWLGVIVSGLSAEYIRQKMVQKMEVAIQVTRDFQFDTVFDISAQGGVKFGYPGLMPRDDGKRYFSDRL